jgi:hypothetical protein
LFLRDLFEEALRERPEVLEKIPEFTNSAFSAFRAGKSQNFRIETLIMMAAYSDVHPLNFLGDVYGAKDFDQDEPSVREVLWTLRGAIAQAVR